MMLADFHVHTTYCDGKNSAEEMIRAALDLNMKRIGFSSHSHTPFDQSYCMSLEGASEYRREIADLREKYRNRIEVLCGIEQDVYAIGSVQDYDYAIGSVHYLKVGEAYFPVDESADAFVDLADRAFGGDYLRMAEEYFFTVAKLVHAGVNAVGHFDLITKFNRNNRFFPEQSPRYGRAARTAADALLACELPFEINTGSISRGYLDRPYPAPEWIEYLAARGGRFLLSSDSHSANTLCYAFDAIQKAYPDLRLINETFPNL